MGLHRAIDEQPLARFGAYVCEGKISGSVGWLESRQKSESGIRGKLSAFMLRWISCAKLSEWSSSSCQAVDQSSSSLELRPASNGAQREVQDLFGEQHTFMQLAHKDGKAASDVREDQ